MTSLKGILPLNDICKALAVAVALAAMAACGKMDETISKAQDQIVNALKTQGVYERDNLPIDNPPSPEQHKGDFDVVDGAYRYISNERRDNRNASPQIAAGDSLSFRFDARIFTGGSFDNLTTFYTNIESRISQLKGNNAQFAVDSWPTTPLKIRVGDDRSILKSLQKALISCRAGDGDPSNDELPENVPSDRVLVYLTHDIAFGDRAVYNVPARSTLVFEITDLVIIKK